MKLRWVWLGVPLLFIACQDAGDEIGPLPGPSAGAGEEGAGDVGGAGGGGEAGDGGTGGAVSPALQLLIEAAEEAADGEIVSLDDEELLGVGFELAAAYVPGAATRLAGSLCPSTGWVSSPEEDWSARALETLHVRSAASGGLEAVLSTSHEGERALQVTPMQREGRGFLLQDVQTCARTIYSFEERYITERYEAVALYVTFQRSPKDGSLQAILAATAGSEALVDRARQDTSPPEYRRISLGPARRAVDDFEWLPHVHYYVFSEPVAPDSQVIVKDAGGELVDVQHITQHGYLLGFIVADALAAPASLTVELQDLNRLSFSHEDALFVENLTPLAGDFEADVAFDDLSQYMADGACQLGATSALTTAETGVDVPALEGARSFFVLPELSECQVAFRLRRAEGAGELRLAARSLGAPLGLYAPELEVCVSSLGAGGDDFCATRALDWPLDSQFAEADAVSAAQALSFELPPAAAELLVTLRSPVALWFDDLRTE